MKVILRENIESLGRTGDLVNVAVGYARNYLLPKNLAYTVTAENLKRIELDKKRQAEKERVQIREYSDLAKRIEETSCTIEAKASEEGHLYGSVTAQMISEALAKEGFEIEPRSIHLERPIKETGVFTVPVHLHSDVNAELKVWVMEPQGESGDSSEG
jgi:large subunit ribosomal protein L9